MPHNTLEQSKSHCQPAASLDAVAYLHGLTAAETVANMEGSNLQAITACIHVHDQPGITGS